MGLLCGRINSNMDYLQAGGGGEKVQGHDQESSRLQGLFSLVLWPSARPSDQRRQDWLRERSRVEGRPTLGIAFLECSQGSKVVSDPEEDIDDCLSHPSSKHHSSQR